jgi:CheY-like chemotaxis protein
MTTFRGLRLLVAEDEVLIALALEDILSGFSCEVLGPVSTVDEALPLAELEELDGAILDLNLRGTLIYPVADVLLRRNIPMIFCTGYSESGVIPGQFAHVPHVSKPYDERMLETVMERAFGAGTPARTD